MTSETPALNTGGFTKVYKNIGLMRQSARRCGTGARNTQQLQKLSCIPRPIVISQQSWTQPWPLTGSRVHKPSAECDSNVSNTWILPAPSGIKQNFFFSFCHLGENCALHHCLPIKSRESQWLKPTSARGYLPLLKATSWWNSWFRTPHQAHLSPCQVVLYATWI